MSAAPSGPDVNHLTLIQSVITRLAGNSFLIKGWAVTLTSALSAFAAKDADRDIAWVGAGAAVVFAGLDAMYLASERAYRALYKDVVDGKKTSFDMAAGQVKLPAFLGALFSWSVLPIYLLLAIGAAAVTLWI